MNRLKIVKLGPNGELFHRGFIVRSKNFRVFMHRFMMSDPDHEFHNHPFEWSFSIILWGTYVEKRLVGPGQIETIEHGPGSINVIKKTDFHRVTLESGDVFTLFFAGPKTGTWGFKDPDTFVYESSEDFFKRKNVTAAQDIVDID
jgi:hypothetical protein